MVLYSDNNESVEWINMCWRKVCTPPLAQLASLPHSSKSLQLMCAGLARVPEGPGGLDRRTAAACVRQPHHRSPCVPPEPDDILTALTSVAMTTVITTHACPSCRWRVCCRLGAQLATGKCTCTCRLPSAAERRVSSFRLRAASCTAAVPQAVTNTCCFVKRGPGSHKHASGQGGVSQASFPPTPGAVLQVPRLLKRLRILEFTLDHEAPYFSNMRRRTSRRDSDLNGVVDVRYTGGARMLLLLEVGSRHFRVKVGSCTLLPCAGWGQRCGAQRSA